MALCCPVETPDIFLVLFWREASTSHLELFHRDFLGLLCHTDIFLARKTLWAKVSMEFAHDNSRLTSYAKANSISFPIPLVCMTQGHEVNVALSPARSSFVCRTSNGESRISSTSTRCGKQLEIRSLSYECELSSWLQSSIRVPCPKLACQNPVSRSFHVRGSLVIPKGISCDLPRILKVRHLILHFNQNLRKCGM